MTSEQKVKKLWPEATITRVITPVKRVNLGFKVTIKPGRYCYGRMKSWAWKAAWDSITQDEELSRGASPQERAHD